MGLPQIKLFSMLIECKNRFIRFLVRGVCRRRCHPLCNVSAETNTEAGFPKPLESYMKSSYNSNWPLFEWMTSVSLLVREVFGASFTALHFLSMRSITIYVNEPTLLESSLKVVYGDKLLEQLSESI